MYLHEYQSKNILKSNNIFIPKSILLERFEDIFVINEYFSSEKLVLKAQVHSGSRASSGGIIFVNNIFSELSDNIKILLSSKISTNQTLYEQKIVEKILIEEYISFSNSFYLSLFVDKIKENISFLFSSNSGSFIESSAKNMFFSFSVEPIFGISNYQVKYFLKCLNLDGIFFDKVKFFLTKLLDIFISHDIILLEINPLVLYCDEFFCLDAKIEIDENAVFRQKKIFLSNDFSQYDFLEIDAKKNNLNYISLKGNIGCIVNGAGLAMATMDLIKFCGGEPANFLDIGGDATEDKVFNAIRIINLNSQVACIFVNIFGGIVQCDFIANSIIKACNALCIKIPIVVRFIGNMAIEGLNIIKKSNLFIHFELDFYNAVEKAVYFSREKK